MAADFEKHDDRYEELLLVARNLLIKNGLPGLGIEQLAKAAGYSRPTIYNHFSSKQAVLDALAQRNLEVTKSLMARAREFKGETRARAFGMILAYEVMARFHPDEFHMTEFLGMPWVRDKLPEELGKSFAEMVTAYYTSVAVLVEQAVDDGDLELSDRTSVGNVVFHGFSMTYGIYTSIIKERIILKLSQPRDPWAEGRDALNHYWDGLGWKATSDQVDYVEVADQFLKKAFPEYWVRVEIERLKREVGMDDDEPDPESDPDEGPENETAADKE